MIDRRTLTFGCAAFILGAATVGAVWATISRPSEPAFRQSEFYLRCVAYGRDTTACDAAVKLDWAIQERKREEAASAITARSSDWRSAAETAGFGAAFNQPKPENPFDKLYPDVLPVRR